MQPDSPTPPCWRFDQSSLRICFLGLGAPRSASDLRSALTSPPEQLSWLRQVHSSRVIRARAGLAGEGDALVTDRVGLGLAIATADCVPVILSAGGRIAAIHAGWRGLVSGVLPAALASLAAPASDIQAWIGPSIGGCCYEIGRRVAESLTVVSHHSILRPGARDRPHADLPAVARYQLETHGVDRIRELDLCTHCEDELLESYRRDGKSAGRNWAVVWIKGPVA